VTVWYVARNSTSPFPAIETAPIDDTVANDALDDCHWADVVTSRDDPSEICAKAFN
jgi:hypothetical protein